MFRLSTIPLASALLLTACNNATAPSEELSTALCISGGIIHTANDAQPSVDAVVVEKDIIAHAGPASEGWCPEGAATYDLAGHTLYPGLTDAHAHLDGIGKRVIELDLSGVRSIVELQEAVRNAAENVPAGETVVGRGWIETFWPEERFPNRYDLDAATDAHPVILVRADGHAAVVNSLALSMSDIVGSTESPEGGSWRINRAR